MGDAQRRKGPALAGHGFCAPDGVQARHTQRPCRAGHSPEVRGGTIRHATTTMSLISDASRGLRTVAAAILLVACGEADPAAPGVQIPTDGTIAGATRFLVEVSDGIDPKRVAADHGVTPSRVFRTSWEGFSAPLSDELRFGLVEDPRVLRVESDHPVVAAGGEQQQPGWQLDRIDQRDNLLDGVWRYDYEGNGTTAYVVDTGIRASHLEFEGRARAGFDAYGGVALDCNGHGTHVAASIAGKRFGVAKSASVVGVRVLDCDGNGRVSDVIAGLDWVLATHGSGPAVVNLSFGGTQSSALDAAVERVLDAGLLVITSAGNSGEDACFYSPARVDGVLTIAATDRMDRRPSFSNHGPCVDLFAPGVDVRSAHHRDDTDEAVFTGTSVAAPLAAGVALMALERTPHLGPTELHTEIWRLATSEAVKSAASPNPNLLFAPHLQERFEPLPPLPPPPPPAGVPGNLAATADGKFVRIVVTWEPISADEVELQWRPEDAQWQSERLRSAGKGTTLKHLRSSTLYELRVRTRTRTHGTWTVSEWSESVTARTCIRKGKSAVCT